MEPPSRATSNRRPDMEGWQDKPRVVASVAQIQTQAPNQQPAFMLVRRCEFLDCGSSTRHVSTNERKSSVSVLPPEILIIIFEELQANPVLPGFRFVSHQFDALIAPILYHRITLTWDIARAFGNSSKISDWSPGQLQLSLHTRYVVVDQRIPWSLVCDMLLSLEKLDCLTYVKS